MMVEKDSEGGLALVGNIAEATQEAFDSGRYVEAFALLHAEIDWLMVKTYQFFRMSKGTADDDQTWDDMVDDKMYRFKDTAEFLRDVGIIDDDVLGRLVAFDRIRNKIIHHLVSRSDRPRKGNKVTLGEVQSEFEEGKKMRELLRKISNDKGIDSVFKVGARRISRALFGNKRVKGANQSGTTQ
jgi:hypothetical protein